MKKTITCRRGRVGRATLRQEFSARVGTMRAAGVSLIVVALLMSVLLVSAPKQAAGAVDYAVAEEIAHIKAGATNDGETAADALDAGGAEASLALPEGSTLAHAASSSVEAVLPSAVSSGMGDGAGGATLRSSTQLDVPSELQYPFLPTGCESVALTDTLEYYGFDLGVTDIADYWLPLSDTDFVNAFLGDPYNMEGNACMAPCITQTAEAFLADRGSSLSAFDVTGLSLESLLELVSAGTPVIAWCTIDLAEPSDPYLFAEQDGRQYELYAETHCVVVSGYDLDENCVFVCDPLVGYASYDLATFALRYYELGAQAVVIA